MRDAIAWLRVLADPADSAAAARALTRPPIELPPADLARLTTIARRRKLDMVSACEAALESPRIPPEARERIQDFLKLYGEASAAMEERRADVFVRRLIERVGIRRQRLFAAQPEVAERLLGLSRLAELATAWARREPHGSTRDFVRHLSAVAETGVEPAGVTEPPAPDSVQGLARDAAKGMGFDHVFVLGLEQDDAADRIGRPARSGLVLSRIERDDGGEVRPSPFYTGALAAAGAKEERHAEELFGPAEGLHATYRSLREEVLEESWKAGRQLSEPRLDTAVDVNRAIARFLELLKLAALAQRPGDAQPTEEAVDAVNGLLRQVATPEQQAELDASALDSYLLDSERRREGRRKLIGARHEPSLEAFLPRRGDGGLSLSASDLGLYLTCPLKYKFARVFGIPQEPTINQRFGILIHNVLERFHKEESDGGEDDLERLMALFEAGWRRSGFGTSDDELQYRERAREALRLYCEREGGAEGEPVWLERKFDIKIGDHHVRGRVDRVDRLPDGEHELIDYKTGERKSESDLESDLQLALYRLAARQAWDIEAVARQLLLRPRRREGRGPDQARRRRAGRADRARGRRRDPRPGLRAPALTRGLQLVRLPADLPRRRELSAPAQLPCWRRKRWNSRAIESAEGRSSPSLELLDLLGLDPLDELGDLGVGGDGAADLLLVAVGFLLELAGLDRDPGQALEAPQQRQPGLRVGDGGDVVGHRGPERGRGDPDLVAAVVEDADDPGRAFVAGALQLEVFDQVRVGGEPGDRDRERVRDLGDQRPHRHHHLDPESVGGGGDRFRERPPAKVRLGPVEEDEVALGAGDRGRDQVVLGPLDVAGLTLGQGDRRPRLLEVEVVLGIDPGDQLGLEPGGERGERGRGGAGGVVPAPEAADEDRGAQRRDIGLPGQRIHRLRLPMGLCSAIGRSFVAGRQRPAHERVGDEQGQRREGEFERPLRDRVGDDDADQHPERREGADPERVARC